MRRVSPIDEGCGRAQCVRLGRAWLLLATIIGLVCSTAMVVQAQTIRPGGEASNVNTAMMEALQASSDKVKRRVQSHGVARALGRGGSTGLLLPRFVSLRGEPVNLRMGPGTEYPVALAYQRAGLPIEVVQEFEAWRKVRDWDGVTGWVLAALLSGRRTVIVEPWPANATQAPAMANVPMYESRRITSDMIAQVEPGTVASVKSCDGVWCDVTADAFRGYIEQRRLWGVYPGETVR